VSAPALEGFAFLEGLDPEERARVAGELDCLVVGPGYRVCGEGDEGEGLVFVAEGRVRVASAAGGAGADAEFGPGTTLGGLSLVAPGARRVSIETLSRSRLFLLRRSAYERLVGSAPRAACRLLEALLRESAALVGEALAALPPPSIDRSPGAP
jgi:CRP-like cAMP-binding protein